MLFIDPENTPDFKRSLFNAIVAPRPIGWISTMGPEGSVNLAPFSHFQLVSTAPPGVIFSFNSPTHPHHKKNTTKTAGAPGKSDPTGGAGARGEPMNISSLDAPYGIDEFELAGLDKAPSRKVRPPRVACSPASMECKL